MNELTERELHEHLQRALDPLSREDGIEMRFQNALRERSVRSPARGGRWLAAAALGLSVVVVFAAVLVEGIGLRGHQQNALPPGGATSSAAPPTASGLIWLTTTDLATIPPPGSGQRLSGYSVTVIDWTGTVHHQFTVPDEEGIDAQPFQAVALDGSMALLGDGTVLDASGATIAHLTPPAGVHPGINSWARFADNDSGVCEASSGTRSGDPAASLDFVTLDGHSTHVASVGTATPAGPVTANTMPAIANVLACSRRNDTAIVAQYLHPGATDGSTTISAWAVRMSSGEILWQQPATKVAPGRFFAYASATGALLTEQLYGTGSNQERDEVFHIPSGALVPGTDSSAIYDTPALSADGTRILRREIAPDNRTTKLQLLDATTGAVVHTWTTSGSVRANAVPEPSGAGFLVEWQGQLLYLDAHGNTYTVPTHVSLNPNAGPYATFIITDGVQD